MSDNGQPPHLLIDGKNVMYRAIFANLGNNGKRQHHFTVMMRFIHEWVERFKPSSVNIFWDVSKNKVWRRRLYHSYKDRDSTAYKMDVSKDIIYTQSAAKALFKFMGVRQFGKKQQEADDLIYSACRVLAPQPVVVVSTDQDLHQIPFRMSHAKLFEPMKKEMVDRPNFDPVIMKALAGDKSDTIDGYEQIGPVKGGRMAQSLELLDEFLEDRGRKIFLRNLLLMDLSYNPHLVANDRYVAKKLCETPKFDKKLITEAIRRHKVNGLMSDYARTVVPLRVIAEKTNAVPS